ncbi:hypothetical protein VP01_9862g1 [Puccinia sorghi]|uniref:Uncharacterized protein n=1 Tax=Puccinia sorghi TaxID=27349 RepID=A0A0L6U630_9BASI|nr:hypothetical protein VP01_9862g1 [Puccinia sorghi]
MAHQQVKNVQIVFSSIWLNLDLEVVAFLIPLVKVLQSSPEINCVNLPNLSGKVVGDQTIL